MKKITKTLLSIVAVVAVIGLAAAQLLRNQEEVQAKVYRRSSDAKAMVKVDTVHSRQLNFESNYLGEFRPNREITITAESQGKVLQMGVQEGDHVTAGTLIARIDSDLLQAQLIGAQSTYDNARLTLQRYENAALGEGISQSQLDNARTQLRGAESQLKQLQKQIALTRITAPFGGIITARYVDFGSVVSNNTQLARLTDISTLKLEVNVPEKEVLNFREGQTVNVVSDVHPGVTYPGKVTMVGARAAESHQYTVQIAVPNSRTNPLKAGMYGSLKLEQQTGEATLAIPRLALLGSAKEPKVYVVERGRASLRSITTGRSNDTQIEVLRGLQPGDVVVLSGQVNLGEQTPVTVSR